MKTCTYEEMFSMPNGTVFFTMRSDTHEFDYELRILCGDGKDIVPLRFEWNRAGESCMAYYSDELSEIANIDNYYDWNNIKFNDNEEIYSHEDDVFFVLNKTEVEELIRCLLWAIAGADEMNCPGGCYIDYTGKRCNFDITGEYGYEPNEMFEDSYCPFDIKGE